MPLQLEQLPTLHYYERFYEMTDFILRHHSNILNEAERAFIQDFRNLDLQAQCLYIRMYNRTKPIFHLNDLLYEEIGTYEAIEELTEYNYLRSVTEKDYKNLLENFTKPRLIELAKAQQLTAIKSSLRKPAIVQYLYEHVSFSDLISSLPDLHYYVPLRLDHIIRFKTWRKPRFDIGLYEANNTYDPHQIYVVVDVETTGTRTPAGRITEIGAVKVQNGQIIGEWSSLINPETYIPPFITEITGIDNDMVKNAPFFYQIAEDFEAFMDDAIFVAHNVNFDYGFIAAELKRVGKQLQKTKLCTVASMRQYYPGHGSYSLANLCKEYAISLTHHHRALCDAQAAAQLLFLVNEKRLQRSLEKHRTEHARAI